MCQMSRLLWSYAVSSLRKILEDKLLATLVVILLIFLTMDRRDISCTWFVREARLGVLFSLAGLMASSNALLGSGYPSRAVSKILSWPLRPWAMIALLSVFAGLLASVATNDASLFVSIPTAVLLSRGIGEAVEPAFTVALVTAASNTGSALTPIGNPQNMLLAREYGPGFALFTTRMAPFTIGGLAIITGASALLARKDISAVRVPPPPATSTRGLLAGLLGIVSVVWGLETSRLVYGGLLGLLAAGLLYPSALLGVSLRLIVIIELFFLDFSLLSLHLAPLITGVSVSPIHSYLYGVLVSQVVSNVPASVLLAGKTPYWLALSYGVNAGGILVVWGSLANIIALRLSGVDAWRFQAYTLLIGFAVFVWGLLLVIVLC